MQNKELFNSVSEALTIELADYKQVSDMKHFSRFTENHTYQGAIFFNQYNLIFTDKKDYEHCLYYNKKGIVCELSLPTYDFSIYIMSYHKCPLLEDAINYKFSESL